MKQTRITIAQVSTSYLPSVGGIEIAIKNMSEALAKKGFNVLVISSLQNQLYTRYKIERVGNLNVMKVPSIKILYNELTIPLKIPKEMLRKSDIIFCWAGSTFFPYLICKEAKKIGKKIITYIIGVEYLQNHYNAFIRFLGYPYQKFLTTKWLDISDLVLVTNEFERKILNEIYGVEAIVLPHGVSKIFIEAPKLDDIFRKKYNVKEDLKIFSYIGRIHFTKGIDVAIKALPVVANENDKVRFFIAGKGDMKYLNKCMKLAAKLKVSDYIRYLGFIPEPDKIGLIDASRFVLLPTRHSGESFPLSVEESIARGKPVIISDASKALSWRILNYKLGYIFRKDDPVSLTETILTALKKRTEVVTFKYSVSTWEEIVNKLSKILYSHVLN
ncbi:MAG: glycosyltransferase family 4 protein [Nitrososphaeria archaeon]